MSYDKRVFITHQINTGANQIDLSQTIKGPSGKRGKLEEIMFTPTDTTALGSAATVKVGTAGDDDHYGLLSIANGLTAGTVKRGSADGTMTNTTIDADSGVVIALATSADTDDMAGVIEVTFGWYD